MTSLDRFSTARLRAERLVPDHRDELYRMDRDPGFMALLGGVRDRTGTERYLDSNLRHWTEHGFGLWMLRDAVTGEMAGRAIVRRLPLEGADEVEIGYGFFPAWWGRGLATEIARECVRIGLGPLGLHSLVGITLPVNTASRRVLEKAGLRYERDVLHEGLPHVLYRIGPSTVITTEQTCNGAAS